MVNWSAKQRDQTLEDGFNTNRRAVGKEGSTSAQRKERVRLSSVSWEFKRIHLECDCEPRNGQPGHTRQFPNNRHALAQLNPTCLKVVTLTLPENSAKPFPDSVNIVCSCYNFLCTICSLKSDLQGMPKKKKLSKFEGEKKLINRHNITQIMEQVHKDL